MNKEINKCSIVSIQLFYQSANQLSVTLVQFIYVYVLLDSVVISNAL